MPYIKTTLTDREIHLITFALQNIGPRTAGLVAANPTLITQVSREYTNLQAFLERFVSDLTDETPHATPPARVKPFAPGQPLFKFNVYSNFINRPPVSPRHMRESGTNAFAPVDLGPHSYVRVEDHGELPLSPELMRFDSSTHRGHHLIGSMGAVERALTGYADCVEEDCECQEGYECPNDNSAVFVDSAPYSHTAYLPATSPVLEYINTHRRRRCRDEMLADMSGSLLPLLTREEIRETLNINRTELRYAESPALLAAHKIMALASIANTAPAEYLDDANIVATIDVLL